MSFFYRHRRTNPDAIRADHEARAILAIRRRRGLRNESIWPAIERWRQKARNIPAVRDIPPAKRWEYDL